MNREGRTESTDSHGQNMPRYTASGAPMQKDGNRRLSVSGGCPARPGGTPTIQPEINKLAATVR
jgi:hypothetical protein